LAVTRAGIISVRQLRRNRRYAILVIAVLALLLPGTDPLTMILSMAPLVVLYEASILLAALLERREQRALARDGPDDELIPDEDD
jgi:sec-independent protein translocase protein TatC